MSRFFSTFQKDAIVQVRNNIYSVTLLIALLFGVIFAFAVKPEHLAVVIPIAMLFVVGGTTFMFIGSLILDEKDKGILNALVLSPLSKYEYLWSKIISLTFLATLEVSLMAGIPIGYLYFVENAVLPNIPVFLSAIIAINLMYTMMGIIVTVRFRKMTDYLIPVVVIMIFLQVPILYFANIVESKLLLIIPSAAPVMLVQGAFNSIDTWQWIYGGCYTVVILIVCCLFAFRAYKKHIIERLR